MNEQILPVEAEEGAVAGGAEAAVTGALVTETACPWAAGAGEEQLVIATATATVTAAVTATRKPRISGLPRTSLDDSVGLFALIHSSKSATDTIKSPHRYLSTLKRNPILSSHPLGT
jgi:hypothetical protein